MNGSFRDFVKFTNVSKTYDGEKLVIKDLNLDIAKGEFVSLLGPSGSGKSTALMLLAGFEPPTSGTIHLNGKLLNKVQSYERNIGVVFQNYALFPNMTVLENISYPLRARRVSRSETAERAAKALDLVQLGTFGDRYPNQLSGGQQQRVAVARALVFDPSLVLMDEPLGALDKKLREEMQIEIKHIHEELGVTMVFVTHDQDEALTMSNRIAVIADGKIQQIDSPSVLYERPANRFVASFVGETNFLAGSVQSVESGIAHVTLKSGETVRATPVDLAKPGDSASISVRPERLRISDSRSDGCVKAAVVETIYHGANAKVVFELTGGQRISAQMRAGELSSRFDVGTKQYLTFGHEDARLFAGSVQLT